MNKYLYKLVFKLTNWLFSFLKDEDIYHVDLYRFRKCVENQKSRERKLEESLQKQADLEMKKFLKSKGEKFIQELEEQDFVAPVFGFNCMFSEVRFLTLSELRKKKLNMNNKA